MEKQDLIILIACIGMLLIWGNWFIRQPPPTAPPQQVATSDGNAPAPSGEDTPTANGDAGATASGDAAPDQGGSATADGGGTDGANVDGTADSALTAVTPPTAPQMAAGFGDLDPAPLVSLSTDVATFKIDPERGGIVDVVLSQFKNHDRDGPMRLASPDAPMLGINTSGATAWKFSHAKVTATDDTVAVERAILGTPLVLKQVWQLRPKTHFQLDYSVQLLNTGAQPVRDIDATLFCGALQPLNTAEGLFGSAGIDQRVDVKRRGTDSPKMLMIKHILKADSEDRDEHENWEIDWVAVQNKYFASIVVGEEPSPGCRLDVLGLPMPGKDTDTGEAGDEKEGSDEEGDHIAGSVFLGEQGLAGGELKEWNFHCYIGPKRYDLLRSIGDGQQQIMQFDLFLFFHFGWMRAISLGMLWGLKTFQGWFADFYPAGSYGLAILCLTLLIRMVFWPITHKSTVWSRKMQAIQPLMQELKEKYKDDHQQMSAKTMELYREHKINPVAGCLPIFIQIPVFFALFNVLRSAIELRQVGFLWADDLSTPDTLSFQPLGLPINPFALMMGATMIIQQKTVPTSADPAQQKMMLFMSFFFVLLLYSMPAGLTLYWTMSNIVSIFQYRITHASIGPPPAAADKDDKDDRKKKNKKQ
jgi:YidC/Oxa1 family membrane protein insertase